MMLSMRVGALGGGLAPLGQATVLFQQVGGIVLGDTEAVEIYVERLKADFCERGRVRRQL